MNIVVFLHGGIRNGFNGLESQSSGLQFIMGIQTLDIMKSDVDIFWFYACPVVCVWFIVWRGRFDHFSSDC